MDKVYVVTTAEPDLKILGVFKDEDLAHDFAFQQDGYVTESEMIHGF